MHGFNIIAHHCFSGEPSNRWHAGTLGVSFIRERVNFIPALQRGSESNSRLSLQSISRLTLGCLSVRGKIGPPGSYRQRWQVDIDWE